MCLTPAAIVRSRSGCAALRWRRTEAHSAPKACRAVSVVGSNTLIVYATVPGETASDGTGRNSPFTASLLKHIETPGLEIEVMFKRVTRDVLNTTSGKQQPERLSRLQNELVFCQRTRAIRAQCTNAG